MNKVTATFNQPQPFAVKVIQKLIKTGAIVAPQQTAQWVNKLWFTPLSASIKSPQQAWLDSALQKTKTYNNQDIPWYQWGRQTDPAIALVHGWAGHAGQFSIMGQQLQDAGFQINSFDAPAHGAIKHKKQKTNIVQFSEILQQGITQETQHAEQAPIIIAHSIGSIAAIHAIRQGLKARALIIIGAPVSLEYLLDMFDLQLKIPKKISQKLRGMMIDEFGPDIFQQLDLINGKGQPNIPVLAFHDENDKQVDLENAQALEKIWPDTQVEYTQNLGHNRILADDGVIDKILDFISDLSHDNKQQESQQKTA